MRCPFCGNPDTQVKDSRPAEDGNAIRRRRQCANCGSRFTTFERVTLRALTVVKRDGRRSMFERDKLLRSVMLAMQKRSVEPEQIEQMVSGIVRRIESSGETDIPSEKIGEYIMKALKELDQVAYVRYASVYREFDEVDDFKQFIEKENLSDEDEE